MRRLEEAGWKRLAMKGLGAGRKEESGRVRREKGEGEEAGRGVGRDQRNKGTATSDRGQRNRGDGRPTILRVAYGVAQDGPQ